MAYANSSPGFNGGGTLLAKRRSVVHRAGCPRLDSLIRMRGMDFAVRSPTRQTRPESNAMTNALSRKVLFGSGLLMLALAFVLDPNFATDDIPTPVPEPGTFWLLAIAGVAAVVAAVVGRGKK